MAIQYLYYGSGKSLGSVSSTKSMTGIALETERSIRTVLGNGSMVLSHLKLLLNWIHYALGEILCISMMLASSFDKQKQAGVII